MGTLAAGAVVRIGFPFSDLSQAKVRPAVVIASAGNDDWILAMVTSNPYADPRALAIQSTDFVSGSLAKTSFLRPGRLFTANKLVILSTVGQLKPSILQAAVNAVVGAVRAG